MLGAVKRIFVFCLLWATQLAALPMGNPADPELYTTGIVPGNPCNLFNWREAGTVRVGFYGDYVFNAHLEVDSNGTIAKQIRDTRIMTNAGMLIFNAFRFVDVYGTLGTSTMSIQTNGTTFSTRNRVLDVMFEPSVTWSIGGRGILYRYKALTFGASAQYQVFHPKVLSFIDQGSGDVHYPNSGERFTSHWYQAGIGVTAKAGTKDFQLLPYWGFTVSLSQVKFRQQQELFPNIGTIYTLYSLTSTKVYGQSVGMTALVKEKVSVNFEGHFGIERAMSCNGQINF